jgi:hypothetical protein
LPNPGKGFRGELNGIASNTGLISQQNDSRGPCNLWEPRLSPRAARDEAIAKRKSQVYISSQSKEDYFPMASRIMVVFASILLVPQAAFACRNCFFYPNGNPGCSWNTDGAWGCILYQDGLPCQNIGVCYHGGCEGEGAGDGIVPEDNLWITSTTFSNEIALYSTTLAKIARGQAAFLLRHFSEPMYFDVAGGLVKNDKGELLRFASGRYGPNIWIFRVTEHESGKLMSHTLKIEGNNWKIYRNITQLAEGTVR